MTLVPITIDFDFSILPDKLEWKREKDRIILNGTYYIKDEPKEIKEPLKVESCPFTVSLKFIDTDIYQITRPEEHSGNFLTVSNLEQSDKLYGMGKEFDIECKIETRNETEGYYIV